MKRPRPRPRKQLLLRLGVFLLLGAIINVAVAWAIAIVPSTELQGYHRESPQTFVWIGRREVAITQESGYSNINWLGKPPKHVDEATYRRLIPACSQFFGHDPVRQFDTSSLMIDISEHMVGWPMLSLANRKVVKYAGFESIDDITVEETAIRLPAEWSAGKRFNKTRSKLPLWPLWPGFAINTIFYAALLWVLFYGPGKIRRLVRIRRGCCPACGFIIAPGTCANGLCSECGAALPERLRTQST